MTRSTSDPSVSQAPAMSPPASGASSPGAPGPILARADSIPSAEDVYAALKAQIAARLAAAPADRQPVLVGIHTGGAWVAQRLHQELCPDAPLGFLSSAFHRDDYSARGLRTGGASGHTQIAFKVDDAHILLIDDVLYTGRTVRAALNELFDYGRPRSVELAALVDRGGRELPVHASIAGCRIELSPSYSLVLGRAESANPHEGGSQSALFTLELEAA